MTARAWGAGYRQTTVCIDSYENGIFAGRFYNPYLKEGKSFQSITQFLLEMEQVLDALDFPKAFAVTRTFMQAPAHKSNLSELSNRVGKAATFSIQVLFRQNASWQGSVVWMEGGQEQGFRSVLELILLMDNALKRESEEAS